MNIAIEDEFSAGGRGLNIGNEDGFSASGQDANFENENELNECIASGLGSFVENEDENESIFDLSLITSDHHGSDGAGFWDWVVQDGANQEGGSQFAISDDSSITKDLCREVDETADASEDEEVFKAVNKDLAQ